MPILATIARLLNRHIAASTAAQRRLAALEGRSLRIVVEGPGIDVILRAADGAIELARAGEATADATLTGTPLALLGLLNRDSSNPSRAGRVELVGDVQIAETFAEALRFARPDLEEELAGWIGDIAAHQVGSLVRGIETFARKSARALEADVAEYLQEESPWLPAALEAREFYADIERLRVDVERAAARLDKVARQAGADI